MLLNSVVGRRLCSTVDLKAWVRHWVHVYGPPGLCFATSPDLMHWSKPALAITQNQLLQREPEGNWSFKYFSLIDPDSTDKRVLFRQIIKLNWLPASRQKFAAPSGASDAH